MGEQLVAHSPGASTELLPHESTNPGQKLVPSRFRAETDLLSETLLIYKAKVYPDFTRSQ
ncbi:hypothetical protein ASZ78_006705, partial [Callipepla squamata]